MGNLAVRTRSHPGLDKRAIHTMKILCKVNQAEWFRRGIDAPSARFEIEVDPAKLTQEERDFVADHLRNGNEFDWPSFVPPAATYEAFMDVVKRGLKAHKESSGEEMWHAA
jgi:hypothetical protein